MTAADDQPVDDTVVVAEFSALADEVRAEFATAVEHLAAAAALAENHRRRHNELMQRLAIEYPAPGRVVVASTRMVDLTDGRLDVRPIDPANLVIECAATALAASGLAWPGQPIDINNGPSRQIK